MGMGGRCCHGATPPSSLRLWCLRMSWYWALGPWMNSRPGDGRAGAETWHAVE